jgi:hypothetical protein
MLTKDLNAVIKAGMKGVIPGVLHEKAFQVEFLHEEGFNYEYNGQATFTISANDITEC